MGCQIVALNYQSSAEPMWINSGLFSENGNTGYVLKPRELLENTGFDPSTLKADKVLNIRVLDAFQLPLNEAVVVDPYVKVILTDPKARRQRAQTSVVLQNGFNPMWDQTFKFKFSSYNYAILTLAVLDKDVYAVEELIAFNSVRLKNIRPGLRILPLLDKHGDKIPQANLLLNTWVEDLN
eukprot:TRINITY_DN6138_c0_g2_i1.p1 TRINITY_DN6138_c0_g2~~TRINITY_DN6138_c0_g2_i1.p1  ORF type:complete len:181 (-),score=31.95 TRINITY_DN6138_c0_g2_i1:54-596(-)